MKLYVAGPLTPTGRMPNSAVEYLMNARAMIRAAKKLIRAGHRPFCPALDFMLYFSLDDNEPPFTESEIKDYNASFVDDNEGIVLLDGWETSAGCVAELAIAKTQGMAVFRWVNESILMELKPEYLAAWEDEARAKREEV